MWSWFKRSVVIKLADPNRDVVFIKIDPADKTTPQELYLSRNTTFSLAAVLFNLLNKVRLKISMLRLKFLDLVGKQSTKNYRFQIGH